MAEVQAASDPAARRLARGSAAGAELPPVDAGVAAGLGIDAVVIAAAIAGLIAEPLFWIGHLAAVGVAIAFPGELRRGQGVVRALIVIALAASGAPGAIAAYALLSVILATSMPTGSRLAAWYERIAAATRIPADEELAERIAIGRAMDLDALPPQAFVAVVRSGSIPERQAALGLVARRFSSAYLPALKAALQSDEPVVRVQAAAVAAKVRVDMARAIERARSVPGRDEEADIGEIVRMARDLESFAGSGLLDEADRLAARSLAVRWRRAGRALLEGRLAGGTVSMAALGGTEIKAHFEPLLLKEEAYGLLRVYRRLLTALGKGRRLSRTGVRRGTRADGRIRGFRRSVRGGNGTAP